MGCQVIALEITAAYTAHAKYKYINRLPQYITSRPVKDPASYTCASYGGTSPEHAEPKIGAGACACVSVERSRGGQTGLQTEFPAGGWRYVLSVLATTVVMVLNKGLSGFRIPVSVI
jgi:hypothetical protein